MKVLFTHELFPPFSVGGGEVYCETIVRELVKRGIDVTVVAGSWKESKFEYYEGIPIYRVNFLPSRYFFNVKAFPFLLKVIKKINPDIINAVTYHSAIPAYFASRFFNKPIVLSVLSLFLEEWFRYFSSIRAAIYYFFERLIFSMPYNRIIALDYGALYNLKRMGLEKKSIFIPHPINTSMFYQKRVKHTKPVVGTIAANLSGPTKGTETFISVVEKIKNKYDVDFLVVGNCEKNLKEKFAKLGIEVIPKVPHEKVAEYLNKIDIFIGQGMVAREALACGCLTILNNPTPLLKRYHKPEIEAGIMFVGDPIKIVKQILEMPRKFNSIRQKSFRFIHKNYSTNAVIKKIIEVYEDLSKS